MQNLTLGAPSRNCLVFIDAAVNDHLSLIAGAKPGTEVILLAPGEDGVAQISAFLAENTDIASVHIVSHGSPGSLQLGNTHLNVDTLEQYRSQLQQWQNALSADAELLLYGCNVAAGARGIRFVETLKSLVGVEIAASTNLTGSAAQGGDWDLAMTTGTVEVELAFEPEAIATYASVLAETLIEEDFSDAPEGWTTVVLAGNPETDAWVFDNPGDRTVDPPIEGGFAIYDSDFFSNDDIAENIAFESPVFDVSDESQVFLQFDQYYLGLLDPVYGSEAFVEVYDGTDWQTVYSTLEDAFGTTTLDISEAAAGVENAQIRFRYEGNWSYYWAVDNVQVVDALAPGLVPVGTVQVSESNITDTLEFVLNSKPTSDVTLTFSTEEGQLEAIAPITFTTENWNIAQSATVIAVDDDVDEGNNQTSPISISVSSADSNYQGLTVEDVIAEITDDAIPGYTSYRTVEATFEDLSQLAADNSDIASWIDIGDSYDKITPGGSEGYDINVLELTNKNIDVPGGKPTIYIEGSIHAREYTTAEVVTRFGEYLVENYGTDPDVTWLLDYCQIDINPIANPDGRKFAEQGYLWRKNTNPNPPPGEEAAPFPTYGVDLNRNWDFEWNTVPGGSSGDPASEVYRGASAASEPEVQAVQNFVTSLFPDQRGPERSDAAPEDATGIFLDIHSYGNTVLYPWGSTSDPAPNQEGLRTLGLKFGYYTDANGTPYDIYQAIGLYPTDGTADDWAYGTLGVAGYTWELGTQFFESSEYFEESVAPQIISAMLYAAKAAYRPYQTPFGPESIDVSVDLGQVVAGTVPVVLSATADDTRYADSNTNGLEEGTELPPSQNIVAGRYTIDTPSWIEGTQTYTLTAADGSFDTTVETLAATIDTTGLSAGRHTIFVESQDADGNFGVPSAVFLDVIDAPEGANVLDGTSAGETLVGMSNSDVIYGRDGDDTVAGELGDDILFGNGGDDVLRGDANSREPGGTEGGDDIIYGGDGNDRIGGKGGNDKLYGEAGDDFIWGDDGDDLIWGGLGNDTLVGDDFSGGNGSDTFVVAVGEGTDTISDFQLGEDFIGLTTGLAFDLLSITQNGSDTFIDYNDETLALLAGVQANDLISSATTTFTII